ncbi:MAG: DUF1385 domain-containing protein [Firmicutes bacterium]|nr:DUF1385 domain-containing protein [Bacillota bacterium]
MKKTNIGGQALIEGLLMIGPKSAVTAIRKANDEIIIQKKELPPKGVLSKIPIIRGITGFVRQMVLGMKALMYSAEFVDIEEEADKPTKFDKFIERLLGDKLKDVVIYFSVIIAIILGVSLFILLPNFLAGFIKAGKTTGGGVILRNLVEGIIRIVLFLTYIALASKIKDIKRIWQYHGAEHKTIHCYEHAEELTVENVRKYSTKHPRCGTSFLFLVMIVSIIVFSLVGWHGRWINILLRILLIPLVAGISYELLKIAGRSERKIMKVINAPGLALQLMTTQEPDDKQIGVAIEALKSVLVEDKDADNW